MRALCVLQGAPADEWQFAGVMGRGRLQGSFRGSFLGSCRAGGERRRHKALAVEHVGCEATPASCVTGFVSDMLQL